MIFVDDRGKKLLDVGRSSAAMSIWCTSVLVVAIPVSASPGMILQVFLVINRVQHSWASSESFRTLMNQRAS